MKVDDMLMNFDREKLKAEFAIARPFPYFKIDNFIDPDKAKAIVAAYPTFNVALEQGRAFSSVNERKKVQITDSSKYAAPVAELNDFLASPKFLSDLSYITNMPNLLADDKLTGGGIHVTGPGGRLDVHVDFNFMEDREWHRRLNLLLYLNPEWEDAWGGQIELWDEEVKHCEASFSPVFNRCVVFETNEISYHGVIPVSANATAPRRSFATYYYTKEVPSHWTGVSHSTIFKARPDEKVKGLVMMPIEAAKATVDSGVKKLKSGLKVLLGR
jgi:hypothetical protein